MTVHQPEIPEPSVQRIHHETGELSGLVRALADQSDLAVTIETTGPDPLCDQILCILAAYAGSPVYCFDYPSLNSQSQRAVHSVFQSPARKIFFDGKTILKFFKQSGVPCSGPLFDVTLAQRLIAFGEGVPGSWEAGAREFVDRDRSTGEKEGHEQGLLEDHRVQTAARKVQEFLVLQNNMTTTLSELQLEETADIEFRCIPAVVEMELNGMKLDREKWSSLAQEISTTRARMASRLNSEIRGSISESAYESNPSINLDSQPQILSVLRQAGIPVRSTSRRELLPLADRFPLVQALIDYRKAAKAEQAFTGHLAQFIHPLTGRIHPEYQQIGAATGRFSCRNPNLQQIPRDPAFRRCFVPSEGRVMVIGDYSQIELRVLAEISGDERMREAFRTGSDLHRLTASLILDKPEEAVMPRERQAAKAVNFGLIFAMGFQGLREYARNTFGVTMSESEARAFRQRFFEAYSGIRVWQDALRKNRPLESRTLSGRRRRWSDQARLTELCNTPVQGTAADIMKLALGNLMGRLESSRAVLIGCVHDEIILEAKRGESESVAQWLGQVMKESAESLLKTVPAGVDIEIAESWAKQ